MFEMLKVKVIKRTYILEEDSMIRRIVDGTIDGGDVEALLSKIDEASVRVDEGAGRESCSKYKKPC